MSTRTWIIFAAICIALFGALIFWSGRDRVDVSSVAPTKFQSATENSGNIGDHIFGNKNAKVVLIEYGDFQCPGCGAAYPVVKALSEKYKDQLAFVFRNFPLTQIHPNARAAAAAAEAAGQEGKYWQMHDSLYANQDSWSSANGSQRGDLFAGYAEGAGVKKDAFEKRLSNSSSSINRKINFDIAIGRKVNVNATPTFYLNGVKLESTQTSDQATFEKTLLAAFKEAGVSVPDTK